MNKLKEQREYNSINNLQISKREENQTSVLPLPHHQNKIDRNYFHWCASAEVMEIIRNRGKSPETLQFVEKSLEAARPGTMSRRCDQNAQRTICVPSRLNKRSREEITEIDGELINRAKRLGGSNQLIVAKEISNITK